MSDRFVNKMCKECDAGFHYCSQCDFYDVPFKEFGYCCRICWIKNPNFVEQFSSLFDDDKEEMVLKIAEEYKSNLTEE